MNKDILPPKSAMATSRPILLLLALVALQVANVAAFTPALGKFSHQWKRSAGAQRAGRGGASATSLISCARAARDRGCAELGPLRCCIPLPACSQCSFPTLDIQMAKRQGVSHHAMVYAAVRRRELRGWCVETPFSAWTQMPLLP